MPLAWITGDDLPDEPVCHEIYIPGGQAYLAAFWGAYLLLCEAYNWQSEGGADPDDVAAAFFDAFLLSDIPNGGCVRDRIVGEIVWLGGDAPAAYLACDGAAYDPAAYPDLFAAIGYTFGTGSGDDFRVPDLRGRLPVGAGSGSGLTPRAAGDQGGEETHTLIESELPSKTWDLSHGHQVQGVYEATNTLTGGANQRFKEPNGGTPYADLYTDLALTNPIGFGGDGDHENMPPFLVLNAFIYAGS
jgi:microcystin-dependent protein